MLKQLRNFLMRTGPAGTELSGGPPDILQGSVEAPFEGAPVQLELAGRTLHLYPERPLEPIESAQKDWILVDPHRYFTEIAGFLRIRSGESLTVGRDNPDCQRLFGFPPAVRRRQLEIRNDDGRITIGRLHMDGETRIGLVQEPPAITRPTSDRLANLERLSRTFNGPVELLSPQMALRAIRQVNAILEQESWRRKDSQGAAGGVVELPETLSPVLIGDLHARLDNLLKLLGEPGYLAALERGDACLVFLGDALHCQDDGALEQMESSLLMLDVICQLKTRFPRNVVYIRGNHDSFDESVSKAGVPQGLLFRRCARETRGVDYEKEVGRFFQLLPYVVTSRGFAACHGGPPLFDVTLQDLVDVGHNPKLARQLCWNRPRGPNRPVGYGRAEVKAFRAALGVPASTAVIVGHTPLSPTQTYWINAGNIPDHHVVYSANSHNLAVFVRIGQDMVPLEYPTEPLLDLVRSLAGFEGERRKRAG